MTILWGSTYSLLCNQDSNISSPFAGFAPVHFFLALQAFGCSLGTILCPCKRRCDTLDSLLQSLKRDKANDQGLIAHLYFVGCLVCMFFFFCFLHPTPPFHPPYHPLSVLLKMCVHTRMPPHTYGSQRTNSAIGSGSHLVWDSISCCSPMCSPSYLAQEVPDTLLFLPPILYRPTGIIDVHYGIQLSIDSGDFNSHGHICICTLPTRSFPHHQVSFVRAISSPGFLFSPTSGSSGDWA